MPGQDEETDQAAELRRMQARLDSMALDDLRLSSLVEQMVQLRESVVSAAEDAQSPALEMTYDVELDDEIVDESTPLANTQLTTHSCSWLPLLSRPTTTT